MDRKVFLSEDVLSLKSQSPTSSTTDWKGKYIEVADVLAETRAELDEFQTASKELEEELERELQRTDAEKNRLREKASKAEESYEEWRGKYMDLQKQHNTATSRLQRELETTRQEQLELKVYMRDLEMGNDNLERNERAVASLLADLEGKHAKVIEDRILVEHELSDKAKLEEGIQRLTDELRDANDEIVKLRAKVYSMQQAMDGMAQTVSKDAHTLAIPYASTSSLPLSPVSQSSNDLLLSDLDVPPFDYESNSNLAVGVSVAQQAKQMQRKTSDNISPNQAPAPPAKSGASVTRSNTLPSLSSSTLPKRNPLPYLLATERPPFPSKGSSTSSSNVSVSKSRGVQMVSEMRARVRNLEAKIHSRVPRLRLSSLTRSNVPSPQRQPSPLKDKAHTSTPQGRDSFDRLGRPSLESRKGAESPGWVLIMEETPKKAKPDATADRQRQLSSIQIGPSSFKPVSPDSEYPKEPSPPSEPITFFRAVAASRPSSRLSSSVISDSFKEPREASALNRGLRPVTPTFLPVPSHNRTYLAPPPMEPNPTSRRRSLDTSTSISPSATMAKSVNVSDISKRRQSGPSSSGVRRQSIESAAAMRKLATGPPTTKNGGRSSLPGALRTYDDSAHKQQVDQGEPFLRSDSRLSNASTHSKTSFTSATNFLTKSRIGRPGKRSSARPLTISNELSEASSNLKARKRV